MTPSYTPEPPTLNAPDESIFEHLVKSYYHAKFWVSSLKNGLVIRVGTHFSHLVLYLSFYLISCKYTVQTQTSSAQVLQFGQVINQVHYLLLGETSIFWS